jgi:WD40 repeat protein
MGNAGPQADKYAVNASGVTGVAVGDRAQVIQHIAAVYNIHQAGEGAARITASLKERFRSLLEERHALFGGRERELERLNSFLVQQPKGYVFVTGHSGFGKTALLANWVKDLRGREKGVCYHFISRTDGSDVAGADFALRNLCQQLVAYHELAGQLPASTAELRALYPQLLSIPPVQGKELIVVIDGLDEAIGWTPGSDLFPRSLPPGVFVVFSAREIAEQDWLASLELPTREVEVLEVKTLGIAEISQLLGAVGDGVAKLAEDSAFVRAVCEKSGGDPFYLRYLVEDIRDKPIDSVEQLQAQPSGLKAYLDRWWKEVSEAAGEQVVRDLLGYLLVAKGRLTRDDLTAISKDDDLNGAVFERTVGQAQRFVLGNEADGYQFCHPRFRDYIAEERIKETEQRPYRQHLLSYCAGWAKLKSRYALTYYPQHLVEAGHQEDLRRLLLDFNWLQAKVDATDVTALISDYDYLLASSAPLWEADADLPGKPVVIRGGRHAPTTGNGIPVAPDSLPLAASSLALVRDALRLSAHVLAGDKHQLAGQVIGRLLSSDQKAIRDLCASAQNVPREAWLRPTSPTLVAPGGPLVRTFVGHKGVVDALAVDADGLHALSGSAEQTVNFWDLRTGNLICTLEGHDGWVLAVAFAPDNNRAISGSADGTVKIWDIETRRLLQTLKGDLGRLGRIYALAITGDGRRLVSGSNFGYLSVWDLAAGTLLYMMKEEWVYALAITRDDRYVFSASESHVILQWDLSSGDLVRVLKGHQGPVHDVALTSDGHRAISVSKDGTLKVWDLEFGREVLTIEARAGELHALALTPDGHYALVGAAAGDLTLCDIQSGDLVRRIGKCSGMVNAIAIMPNSRYALVGAGSSLTLWDLEAKEPMATSTAHPSKIHAVGISPDRPEAVSCSSEVTVKRWDLESHQVLGEVCNQQSNVVQVSITPDGRRAFSGSGEGILRAFDLESNKLLFEARGHKAFVRAVALTPDGNRGVSASGDWSLRLWDLRTGTILGVVEWQQTMAYSVALSSDGRRLLAGCDDNIVRLWNLESGELICTFSGHDDAVTAVALSPDGSYAVSGSSDGIRLWDLASKALVHKMEGPHSDTWCVALTADGRWILAGSGHTLNLWNRDHSRCLDTFTAEDTVQACSVTPDGKRIVAGDSQGRVYFFELIG